MPGPNFKEDYDRMSPGPAPQVAPARKKLTERELLLQWLQDNASYTDETGMMYFPENYRANKAGEMFYPSGGYADGIRLDSPPPKPALSGRYTTQETLTNRYTVAQPDVWQQAKQRILGSDLGKAAVSASQPIDIELMARKLGYIK